MKKYNELKIELKSAEEKKNKINELDSEIEKLNQ